MCVEPFMLQLQWSHDHVNIVMQTQPKLYCLKALIGFSQYRQNLLSHLGLAFEWNLALNYEAKGNGVESGIHAFSSVL